MKRKMMAAVLIMAMTAGVLGGCGNSTGNNAKTDTNAQNNANTAEIKENANADVTEIANADGTVYKVGIVQYVDDASLNQIEKAIEAELDAKGAELGVTFDYADYTYNGQADSSTLNQIATDLVAEKSGCDHPDRNTGSHDHAECDRGQSDPGCILRSIRSGQRRTCRRFKCTWCKYHRHIRCT